MGNLKRVNTKTLQPARWFGSKGAAEFEAMLLQCLGYETDVLPCGLGGDGWETWYWWWEEETKE